MNSWRYSKRRNNRRDRLNTFFDITLYLLLLMVLYLTAVKTSAKLGYHWQWYRVSRYLFYLDDGRLVIGPLIEGLGVTLQITGISLLLAFCFGLSTAIFRLSGSWSAKALARLYIESIRNTPLMVQLLFVYFVLAPILGIGRFTSAVLSLSLFEGAYAAEIFRAGILSVPAGQWEASSGLGLTPYQTYRWVILPQAVKKVLPPLTSQAVSLIKDSALVCTIAVYDLTMQGLQIISETYMTFELWFTIAGLYLVLTLTLSYFAGWLEYRLRNERQGNRH